MVISCVCSPFIDLMLVIRLTLSWPYLALLLLYFNFLIFPLLHSLTSVPHGFLVFLAFVFSLQCYFPYCSCTASSLSPPHSFGVRSTNRLTRQITAPEWEKTSPPPVSACCRSNDEVAHDRSATADTWLHRDYVHRASLPLLTRATCLAPGQSSLPDCSGPPS